MSQFDWAPQRQSQPAGWANCLGLLVRCREAWKRQWSPGGERVGRRWESVGPRGCSMQGLMNMVCLKMVTTPPMIFQKENDDWPMELGLAYFQTLRRSHWQREIWSAMILMIFGHFLTSKKLDCDHWFRKANPKPHQQTCFHCHPELLEHEIHVEIWIVLRHLLGRNGRWP